LTSAAAFVSDSLALSAGSCSTSTTQLSDVNHETIPKYNTVTLNSQVDDIGS